MMKSPISLKEAAFSAVNSAAVLFGALFGYGKASISVVFCYGIMSFSGEVIQRECRHD